MHEHHNRSARVARIDEMHSEILARIFIDVGRDGDEAAAAGKVGDAAENLSSVSLGCAEDFHQEDT